MDKRLLMALIAGLVLNAGSLHAQDSGDGSDDSDTSSASDAGDVSPGPASVTDATDASVTAVPSVTAPALDFAAQQAYDAVNNPWGGVPGPTPASGLEVGTRGNPAPGEPGEPGATSPGPPTPPEPLPPITGIPPGRRAQIHAVIVSNLSDPSQVLSGNVNLTGGIIALGPPAPSQKPGRWDPNVQITPDPDLLNGSKIPPNVPNVIDVRITHYEVTATIESKGSISDHP
jgi:hypothetical protein